MIKRNRLALLFGATMTLGALAANNAVAEGNQAAADAIVQEVGLSASSYEYTEEEVMTLKGNKPGFDYAIKFPLVSTWFARGDFRYARGKVDYESNGTGTMENNTNWYAEWRLLSGYDFTFGNHTLGPYTGLGFRYLFHDGRGTSSTGHLGYRRESRYTYLPLGLAHRWSISERMKLTTTIEYDYLLEGRQTSEMGDVYEGDTTPLGTTLVSVDAVKNDQKHGHGWRGSVMLGIGNWTMGPYASYWRVSDSEPDRILAVDDAGNTWIFSGEFYEPKNKTREVGFKAAYVF